MNKPFLVILLCVSLLNGCGWHLRGSQMASSSTLKTLSLSATDIYTPLYRTFKNEYEKRRIDLDNPGATLQLKLLQETTTSHIQSLDTALHPGETELSLHISYEITEGHQPARRYQLQLFRTNEEGIKNAGAIDNENRRLLDEMRKEASERIFNQLLTLSTPAPVASP